MLTDQTREAIRASLKPGNVCFSWTVQLGQPPNALGVSITQNDVREYIEELERYLVKLSINALRNS